MKRYETRVRVEESAEGTKYFAEYKSKLLWFIPIWQPFDWFSRSSISCAVARVDALLDSEHLTMQRVAELLCEEHHRLCDEYEETKRIHKTHEKTKKVYFYKHPRDNH